MSTIYEDLIEVERIVATGHGFQVNVIFTDGTQGEADLSPWQVARCLPCGMSRAAAVKSGLTIVGYPVGETLPATAWRSRG